LLLFSVEQWNCIHPSDLVPNILFVLLEPNRSMSDPSPSDAADHPASGLTQFGKTGKGEGDAAGGKSDKKPKSAPAHHIPAPTLSLLLLSLFILSRRKTTSYGSSA
jgi:hypothetical protein